MQISVDQLFERIGRLTVINQALEKRVLELEEQLALLIGDGRPATAAPPQNGVSAHEEVTS